MTPPSNSAQSVSAPAAHSASGDQRGGEVVYGVERPKARQKLEVLILGGGFSGVYCAKELGKARKKRAWDEGNWRVGLVSDQNYMVFQPMLAEVAGGSLSPRHVVNPIRMLCPGCDVFRGTVTDIDLEKREVTVDTGRFSAGLVIEFEHLVLGLGAEIDLSRVPGMPEHALLMQNVGDAMILRATIISRMEEANAEVRPEIRAQLLTFVVVGGGYSGVETAGEMLDMLHEIAPFYEGIQKEDIRVVLIHSRDRLLHHLSAKLGDYAGEKLQERGLEIILNDRVRAMTATRIYLKSGSVIETNTVISTVGNAPNSLVRKMGEQYGLEMVKGAVATDAELRVKAAKRPWEVGGGELWAAGDCAANPLFGADEGTYCPQTAQFAMRHGSLIGKNILASLRGGRLEPFTFQGLGELASIGHQTAVASIQGWQFSGFAAWFLWRTIYLAKLPGLERKLRVMIDWTLDLFFSRDINLLNPRYTSLYRQVHLEEGDTLFNIGDPAFSLYVVREGRVELFNERGEKVRDVEAGDFFGERTLVHGGGYPTRAQAAVQTELVSLNGEALLPFLRSSRRFRRVLAKTSAQQSVEGEIRSICEKFDQSLLDKPVEEVMHRDLAVLRDEQTVEEALEMFRQRRFSAYPLVGPNGELVGAISREDLYDHLKREGVESSTLLAEVEHMNLPQVEMHQSVRVAIERMIHQGRHKCLVVDGKNHLKGIVTVLDLLGDQRG